MSNPTPYPRIESQQEVIEACDKLIQYLQKNKAHSVLRSKLTQLRPILVRVLEGIQS
jgi:hypothetical protein